MLVEIEVSNSLLVKGLSDAMVRHWKKHLTIPNPKYYKLMHATGNRARAFFGTPKEFMYYKEVDGALVIPRGRLDPLLDFLSAMKVPYEVSKKELIKIPL